MGKSTISMAIFNSKLLVITRGLLPSIMNVEDSTLWQPGMLSPHRTLQKTHDIHCSGAAEIKNPTKEYISRLFFQCNILLKSTCLAVYPCQITSNPHFLWFIHINLPWNSPFFGSLAIFFPGRQNSPPNPPIRCLAIEEEATRGIRRTPSGSRRWHGTGKFTLW